MKKIYLIFLLLITMLQGAWSQNNVTTTELMWHSAKSIIVNTNYTLNQNCKVISNPAESVITVVDGTRNIVFSIVSVEGSWTNVQENGKIKFTVNFGEDPGVVIFEKNDSETFIEIDLSQNPSGVKRKIIVNQITNQ